MRYRRRRRNEPLEARTPSSFNFAGRNKTWECDQAALSTGEHAIAKVPSYRRALALLALVAVLIVLGLPLVFAVAYIITGMSSVGYYGPPIGEVMAFYANAATVLATAVAPVAAVIAALLAVPRIRRFFTSPFTSETPHVNSPNTRATPSSASGDFGRYLAEKSQVAEGLRRTRDRILDEQLTLTEKEEFPATVSYLASLALIRRSETADCERRAMQLIDVDYQKFGNERGVFNLPGKVKLQNIAHNVISTMAIPDEA
jgi:hypothetical protein